MADMVEEDKAVSKVVVTFAAPGSAHFGLNFDGSVSAIQMLALAKQLELLFGNEVLADHLERQYKRAQEQLAVPEQKIVVPGMEKKQ